jgi:hypothetical protein
MAGCRVTYAIESSTGLEDWRELTDSFETDSETAEFVDETAAPDDVELYYRVVVP